MRRGEGKKKENEEKNEKIKRGKGKERGEEKEKIKTEKGERKAIEGRGREKETKNRI